MKFMVDFRTFSIFQCIPPVVKIAHISDLHFGRANEAALDALILAINSERPDLIAITGDFTQTGARREFEAANLFLASLSAPILAVPGNHDTPVYNLPLRFLKPWARFEKHIGAAQLQIATAGDTVVIGLNSARRARMRFNWSYGKLSRKIIEVAASIAKRESAEGKTVFVAAHHPFEKGPNRAGAEIVGNGAYALQRFAQCGVSAVMTGHVHLSAAGPLAITQNQILSIQCGASGGARERGEAAGFGLITVEGGDDVSIDYRHFDHNAYRQGRSFVFSRYGSQWNKTH